jgi:acyl-CoA synthetase (AMP-forming)/AMP-acid ligase II
MRKLLGAGERPALVDTSSGTTWTHAELAGRAQERAHELAGPRSLIFLRAATIARTVCDLLGALLAGHAVALVDATTRPELLQALVTRYAPALVLHPDGSDESPPGSQAPSAAIHPALALLLPTSGTTGSPKLVRLSSANLLANARSIATYLGLGPDERAIVGLPLHYSYGLSVLTSHLVAGGALVLPPAGGLMSREFWKALEEADCTSFAGVPASYAMLERLRWHTRPLPALRTMTQAGGRLEPDVQRRFGAELERRGGRFFVMYGQTEATARIAYLAPERLREKAGSIGRPIPGGHLSVQDAQGRELAAGVRGELVYRGPNVMLGYALHAGDLARGDDLGGVLRTGDLGYRDEDGDFFVTGRLDRSIKVFGHRLDLEDVERRLRPAGPVAAVGGHDEKVHVFLEPAADRTADAVRRALTRAFGLPARAWQVQELDRLPLTSAGKIDYGALEARDA